MIESEKAEGIAARADLQKKTTALREKVREQAKVIKGYRDLSLVVAAAQTNTPRNVWEEAEDDVYGNDDDDEDALRDDRDRESIAGEQEITSRNENGDIIVKRVRNRGTQLTLRPRSATDQSAEIRSLREVC